MKIRIRKISLSICWLALASCNGGQDGQKPDGPPVIQYKKEKDSTNTEKPPVINISDTIMVKKTVLCIRDSAATTERIGIKLAAIYNKRLADIISQQKLTVTGPRMAWYKSSSPPFFFEAGIPVNKKPAKLPKKAFIRQTGGDSAVVAHYFGPYSLTYHAYDALREWLQDHGQKPTSPPYECYIGQPVNEEGLPVDPYKVQTDIVFPHD